ncbi:MAG: GNAT family N-acetyltransferase [Ruminiclostridium sp.]|nr:GNAT family N-acetyltransferase [Ruminiclostridium sp.]
MIRVAEMSDLEQLCVLYKELHEHHVRLNPDAFCIPEDESLYRDNMTDILNSDEWITLVHQGEKGVDGYVVFKAFNTTQPDETPRRICHINQFTVAENARRQGIGRQLMDKVCDAARSIQCDCVRLIVNSDNTEAVAFDREMGFAEDKLLMEKKL